MSPLFTYILKIINNNVKDINFMYSRNFDKFDNVVKPIIIKSNKVKKTYMEFFISQVCYEFEKLKINKLRNIL